MAELFREFEVLIEKEDFKFNCAHFIAFQGFRERLHGHNYRVSVRVIGTHTSHDGYFIDFGDIKKTMRKLCKSMNEFFICPMNSDVLEIVENGANICLTCEDGSNFSFPEPDVLKLPIRHSSAEELAHYICCRLLRMLGLPFLLDRGATRLEIQVAEAPNQAAIFKCFVPKDEEELGRLETCPLTCPAPCLQLAL